MTSSSSPLAEVPSGACPFGDGDAFNIRDRESVTGHWAADLLPGDTGPWDAMASGEDLEPAMAAAVDRWIHEQRNANGGDLYADLVIPLPGDDPCQRAAAARALRDCWAEVAYLCECRHVSTGRTVRALIVRGDA